MNFQYIGKFMILELSYGISYYIQIIEIPWLVNYSNMMEHEHPMTYDIMHC